MENRAFVPGAQTPRPTGDWTRFGFGLTAKVVVTTGAVAAQEGPRLADLERARDGAAVRALPARGSGDVNGALGDGASALHWAAHWDDRETASALARVYILGRVLAYRSPPCVSWTVSPVAT